MSDQNNCCCKSGCCCAPQQKRQLKIDFLYLDLDVCTRCQGTDQSLEEAVEDVSGVLKAADIDVIVNKVNINTKELAIQYKFISSPTVRVNGKDIDVEVKESLCESCGDLCGTNVDCRVWTYQGQEYTVPPKALIVNAILQEVYGNKGDAAVKDEEYTLPENLKKFFEAMETK